MNLRAPIALAMILTALNPGSTAKGAQFFFFQGGLTPVDQTIQNAYSGATYDIDRMVNANTTTYLGNDFEETTILFTNLDDWIELDDGGVQTLFHADVFFAGDGSDILNLSSTSFFLGDTVIFGGRGDDLLWGNVGADQITGDDGDDTIDGGPGDDIVAPGAGRNFVNGGSGIDIAEFGLFSDYTITRSGPDEFRIIRPGVSEDYLSGVEFARFSATTIDLRTIPSEVPEPGALSLLAIGLCAAALRRGRRTG